MAKGRPRKTDNYRIVPIHRPSKPQIARYIDTEFEVIYVNLDAAPGANIDRYLSKGE